MDLIGMLCRVVGRGGVALICVDIVVKVRVERVF